MTRPMKRRTAIAVTALVAAPLAFITTTASPHRRRRPAGDVDGGLWQRTALRTIFTETVPTPPPPVISIYLSSRRWQSTTPLARPARRRDPAAAAGRPGGPRRVLGVLPSLPRQPRRRPHCVAGADQGRSQGGPWRRHRRAAADRMIASRVGDGRNATVVYSKPPAPGIWQPPATGMALAWLGFLKPVVGVPGPARRPRSPGQRGVRRRLQRGQACRLHDVRDTGDRTPTQTEISGFINGHHGDLRDALIRHMRRADGLIPTTRLFAASTRPRSRASSRPGD